METVPTFQPMLVLDNTVPVQVLEGSDTDTDEQSTHSNIPFTAADPATKYRCHLNEKHLHALKCSWIGSDNCTVNTAADEIDTVENTTD